MPNMDINYSIIIPHYNIPDLLMRCIKSIPVREDVQVIVVDDCSPDAETYLERYPELSRPYLEFYSTEKGGSAGRARNVGLQHAKGKWLVFADADDFFGDSISDILDLCIDRTEDILYFDFDVVYNNDISHKAKRESWLKYLLDQYKETGNSLDIRMRSYVVWAKMFKRLFVEENSIRFDEIRYSNDCVFSTKAGMYSSNVAFVDRLLYILTESDDSLTSKRHVNRKSMEIRLDTELRVLSIWKKCSYDTPYKPYRFYLNNLFDISPLATYSYIKRIMHEDNKTAKDMLFILGQSRALFSKVVLYLLYSASLGFRL